MLFTTAPKTAEEEMRWKQTIKCSLVLPGEASGWSWRRLGFFNFSIFLLASLFFSPESEREAFYRRLSLMTTFQPIATAFRTIIVIVNAGSVSCIHDFNLRRVNYEAAHALAQNIKIFWI